MSDYTRHSPEDREGILEARDQAFVDSMQKNPVMKKYFGWSEMKMYFKQSDDELTKKEKGSWAGGMPRNAKEYREFLGSLKKIKGSERYLRSDFLLGEGGMSKVRLGFDSQTGRPIAIKVVSSKCFTDILRREIILSGQLNHHNICQIYDAIEHDGKVCIIEELLDGTNLFERIVSGEKELSSEEIIDIARQISEALQYAHQKGIILNDLKPENIFLVSDPDQEGHTLVKIIDFGVAASRYEMSEEEPNSDDLEGQKIYELLADVRIFNIGATGTPGNCSPEQISVRMKGDVDVDERSDLFSLGTIIYHMLTKKRPFNKLTPKTSLSAIEDQIITRQYNAGKLNKNKSIDPKLSALVEQLLDPNPKKRPQSAKEVTQRLREMI